MEAKTIRLIAAGTRCVNGKRFFCYYELSPLCELGEKHHYSTKLRGYEGIGSVYMAERTEEGIRKWEILDVQAPEGSAGHDSITAWSVESRTAIEELATISRAKKGYGRSVDLIIQELKDATWSLDSRAKKAAFARYVFEKLI